MNHLKFKGGVIAKPSASISSMNGPEPVAIPEHAESIGKTININLSISGAGIQKMVRELKPYAGGME
jgi:hypothetical protein